MCNYAFFDILDLATVWETRLNSESLELLIVFLAFLVTKLWQNNENFDKKSFWVILPKF